MLKLVNKSGASKTAGCAVTYRSGFGSMYSTCPATCPLLPEPWAGAGAIDYGYLDSLLLAGPPGRKSWSFGYTHFPVLDWAGCYHGMGPERRTTLNASVDSYTGALEALAEDVPVVMALPRGEERRVWHLGPDRVPVVRCPAQYLDHVTCANCGGERGPLCARGAERGFIVAFYGHGLAAKAVGKPEPGGCYAAGGNVLLHWRATRDAATQAALERREAMREDGPRLQAWAAGLPEGTVLRHHVAGDIGHVWEEPGDEH